MTMGPPNVNQLQALTMNEGKRRFVHRNTGTSSPQTAPAIRTHAALSGSTSFTILWLAKPNKATGRGLDRELPVPHAAYVYVDKFGSGVKSHTPAM